MQSINGTHTVAVHGSPSEDIIFSILGDMPAVLEGDIFPTFVRYDGVNSSSFSFILAELKFSITPVDIYQDEGNYTLSASNSLGASEHTVYFDVQSKFMYS